VVCGVLKAGKEMWGKEMRECCDREQHMARYREKATLIVRVEEFVEWRHLWWKQALGVLS
jgi:hypothetical protein